MTRPQLRVFLQDWFCGCDSPPEACRALRDLLALHPLHQQENRDKFESLIPDKGLRLLTLYTLDHFDLTEHGGGIGGAWLTEKGADVLDGLNVEAADGFETLCEQCCSHGYSVEGEELEDCAECSALTLKG